MRGQLSDGYSAQPEYRGSKWYPFYLACEYLLFNFITKPDFIAYNDDYRKNLSRRICRKLYRNPAVVWTIKGPQQLESALRHFDKYIFEGFLPGKCRGTEG